MNSGGMAVPGKFNKYDVKPGRAGSPPTVMKINVSQASQLHLLDSINRLEAASKPLCFTGLHLNKYNGTAILGDQVNFTAAAPPVLLDDLESLRLQVASGERFAVTSDRFIILFHQRLSPAFL